MTYKISSDKFQNPYLKPLLEKLTEYFAKEEIHFYVIGATARDIIMEISGEKSGRKTHDLDIAMAISDWQQCKTVEEGIANIDGFEKDKKQKQRFIYQGIFQLDIVPYGAIMDQDDKIFWPPDKEIAMSVLGFDEVKGATEKITIDDELTVDIASLSGIFLLKLIAFKDRYFKGNKDADDMAFIITNYLAINEDNAYENHYIIYEDEDFDTRTAGARLLGRHLGELLRENENTKSKTIEILAVEIKAAEESILVNQILETHRSFSYEITLKCLEYIVQGIDEI